jgi:hypothetical protein
MSIWIRALCRRPLGDRFAVPSLKAALGRLDFASMAESNGLDDEVGAAAEEALRVEGDDDPNLLFLYCRPGEEHFIRIESWQGSAAAEEIAELLESVEDAEGAGAERVRAHLGSTVQSVAFELKASDLTGMSLPIAFYAAMWLAHEGDGLVEYEDDWFDPSVSYVDAILDA